MTQTSETLWTAEAALAATGGEGPGGWQANSISIDSRTLREGDLFVALVGPNANGHDYIANALTKGAAAAMVHQEAEGLPADAPILFVEDTLEGLRRLASAARDRSAARRVAVTGSVGKTSTKEMLRTILSAAGPTHAAVASFNNHWGVPLTLARMPQDSAYAVFEIGMNHHGEIRPLTKLVQPEAAIVTTIAPAHIEYFPEGLSGIATAKSEIFEGVTAGGTAVINRDAPHADILMAKAARQGLRQRLFAKTEAADAQLLSLVAETGGSTLSARIDGREHRFFLGLPGEHMAMNALGAILATQALGVPPETAMEALSEARALAGRGAQSQITLREGVTVTLIDESYNANPTSMRAALGLLGAAEPRGEGRRIAVLGDMLELGAASRELHAALADPILQSNCNLVFCCGASMSALYDALPPGVRGAHSEESADLAAHVIAAVGPGDVLLVKGSLGARMAKIVQALTAAASDAPSKPQA